VAITKGFLKSADAQAKGFLQKSPIRHMNCFPKASVKYLITFASKLPTHAVFRNPFAVALSAFDKSLELVRFSENP
jgi:hypothetical protein